jgi:hypothetical protein
MTRIHEIIKAMKTECAAKTRSGGRCKNAPMGTTGRCRMHGGKSLSGIAHPNYKHGRYSKVFLARLVGEFSTWDAEVLAGIAVEALEGGDLAELAEQPIDLSWVDPSWLDEILQGLSTEPGREPV